MNEETDDRGVCCRNFGWARWPPHRSATIWVLPGLLAKCNRGETIKLTLASGQPLGEDVVLQSGAYYKLEITADGSAELAIEGPSFLPRDLDERDRDQQDRNPPHGGGQYRV